MQRADIDRILEHAVSDRRLLEHPFYRRWEAGELLPGELAAYAGQYRHFEQALTEVLEEVIASLDPGPARNMVQANLDDERSVPAPHLALFDDFVEAVGGQSDAPATPATSALVNLYRSLAKAGPQSALGAVGAYEVQASAIAVSKAEGLRAHYGLSPKGIRFWDVHGTMDADHASWTADAIAALDASDDVVAQASRAAAQAWWTFLDEREEAAASLAAC